MKKKAKLCKACGVPLRTYQLSGGYALTARCSRPPTTASASA